MPAASVKSILSRMRQLEIRTRRLVNDSLIGEYHSVFKGRGMDFDEVREYVPGDEVRSIDWNVTARAGRPFVKKYTEERELNLLVVVDISASGNFGSGDQSKRDLAGEVASLLALSAIRNSDKVGLLLYTDRVEQYIPPKKGRRHVLRVVREILYHTAEGRGTDTVKALEVAGQLLHRRAVVFLISDFQSSGPETQTRPPLRRALRQTNRRHDLVAVRIEDPRESDIAGSRRVVAGGRGVRRGDRDRHRRCRDSAAVQRGSIETRAAFDQRHPFGGRRYAGAQHGFAVPACLAALLQVARETASMTAERHRAIGVRTALFGAAIGFCLASTMTAGAAPAGMQPAAGGAPEASAAPGAGTTGALAPSGLPAANAPPPTSAVPAAPAAGAMAAADDIRDIRGPRPIASPWVLWALVGGGILAALSGYALWRWIKRRRNAPEPSERRGGARETGSRSHPDAAGTRARIFHRGLGDRARIHRAPLPRDGGASHHTRVSARPRAFRRPGPRGPPGPAR